MVVDTIKAYQSATGDEKLAQFLPDNMGQFYTRVIEKGSKKLPGKPEQGLYIKMYNFGPEQIEIHFLIELVMKLDKNLHLKIIKI